MLLLTSAEFPSEANTGIIVALAVWPVDSSEAGCMTHTLAAVALPLTTAYLRLIAGEAVAQQKAFLIAFTLCAHETRLTHAHATVESPLALHALAAVGFRVLPAIA